MDWERIQSEIEDLLFPQRDLDVWERVVYYHLLRQTRTIGIEQALVAIQPLSIALRVGQTKVRDALRSLNAKGCIKIEKRSGQGHFIRVLLPEELGLTEPGNESASNLNLDTLDFFTGRKYVAALLQRERGRCFYCLRSVDVQGCVLDHATPQVNGGDHSYRNVVVSCHECNSRKQGGDAADFLRGLYRRAVLSATELEERIASLEKLQNGGLVPPLSGEVDHLLS